MLLHIPHSNTTIPSYEEQMAKDKDVLEAIEKYTDHRTSELFHDDGVELIEPFGEVLFLCQIPFMVDKIDPTPPQKKKQLNSFNFLLKPSQPRYQTYTSKAQQRYHFYQ